MQVAAPRTEWSEARFAEIVNDLAAKGDSRALLELLSESHSCYAQRGTAAIVRMRGWTLLAFSKTGLPDDGLPFVLEELDAGMDPYLIAAAARALRAYPVPAPDFAPFVLRALKTAAGRDEPVSFESFGDYAMTDGGTSPLRELIETLAWLGPAAHSIFGEAAELAACPGVFSETILTQLKETLCAIDATDAAECCHFPAAIRKSVAWFTGKTPAANSITFEDHAGQPVRFSEFFIGKPSIVVFFYTRCDNPLKCSLTITKVGRIQKLLEERGFGTRIRTAAITYDPSFDLPKRLCDYGLRRGLRLDAGNRMLRCPGGMETLKRRFSLGVNFLGSLVGRHRIEAYVLRANGQIAYSFERLQWDENEVVARAIETLDPPTPPSLSWWGSIASLGVAFFPKCPMCWAAYLSVFGITGLTRIPYASWLEPALACLLLINLASAWISARSSRRFTGACLATAGALAIALSKPELLHPAWGVALTAAGSLATALTNPLAKRAGADHASSA